MYNWLQIAHLIEVNYDSLIDWNDRFFYCPKCHEPVYEDEWESEDDFLDKKPHQIDKIEAMLHFYQELYNILSLEE